MLYNCSSNLVFHARPLAFVLERSSTQASAYSCTRFLFSNQPITGPFQQSITSNLLINIFITSQWLEIGLGETMLKGMLQTDAAAFRKNFV